MEEVQEWSWDDCLTVASCIAATTEGFDVSEEDYEWVCDEDDGDLLPSATVTAGVQKELGQGRQSLDGAVVPPAEW